VTEAPPADATTTSGGPLLEPLYKQVLGADWPALPPSLRRMHDLDAAMTACGTARVETGQGLPARLIRHMFGFPEAARSIPVRVTFTRRGSTQIWTRQFGSAVFSSVQRRGTGRNDRLIVEQFGPISVELALVRTDGRLNLVVRGWRLLGLPLPLSLAPSGETCEFEAAGRFHFHVEIRHPWLGLIVAYSGALDPPEPAGPSAPAP